MRQGKNFCYFLWQYHSQLLKRWVWDVQLAYYKCQVTVPGYIMSRREILLKSPGRLSLLLTIAVPSTILLFPPCIQSARDFLGSYCRI